MKYLIVIEPTPTGFSSYSPDLPGCISYGSTREECELNMREAVEFHVEGLRAEGETIPHANSSIATVEVA